MLHGTYLMFLYIKAWQMIASRRRQSSELKANEQVVKRIYNVHLFSSLYKDSLKRRQEQEWSFYKC